MSTHKLAFAATTAAALIALACGRETAPGAGRPLHLEDRLEQARVEASVPTDILAPLGWRFDAGDAGWRPVTYAARGPSTAATADGALRLELTAAHALPDGKGYVGSVVVDLPELDLEEWGEIRVEARSDGVRWLNAGINLAERWVEEWGETVPYEHLFEGTFVARSERPRPYRLRLDVAMKELGSWQGGPWRQLILEAWSPQPATLDILAVELVPRAGGYREAAGVRPEARQGVVRRTLYHQVPGRVEYRVDVPAGGRLDVALAGLVPRRPLTFRVAATAGEEEEVLLAEEIAGAAWQVRTVDLSAFAGRTVTLALAADGAPGDVAFWGSPIVSGEAPAPDRTASRPPNVVFYVIDGGGADLMSLYGYNRRTTPHLERLAAEGAVFEHAYSNAAWTKPSTASFMTSLQQSALGGFRSLHDPVPAGAPTMAERFHAAGYQTAVFTSNPWAGSLSGLERGVDQFRDHGGESHSTSSRRLHEEFWQWRRQFPGGPWWVHFQTTDVHEPHRPVAPFAGMYVDPPRRARFDALFAKMSGWDAPNVKDPANTLAEHYRQQLVDLGAEPREFFDTQRGLYDETMAHQDEQLGRLVERLKATGAWENTLLVVASDHGHPAGSFSRFGRELFDPQPASDEGALLDSYRSRVPLVFVWPGRIAPGQRLTQQVSMIDVLPTLLELAGLPAPEVLQGQSLAPLLRGEPGWEPRPVILEQLQPVPEHDALVGHIEMIDGRWGASLEIWPADLDPAQARPHGNQRAARPHRPGMPRLYLYDLWNDPFALARVNDEHPELVEKYTRLLVRQWRAHQALGERFERGEEAEIDPEQLETLRSLGYIQ